ncbi:MAG: hypothetical protein Q4C42_02805 [Clostridia bacterium]|nr:hypothetical protein [Clostridia bacterium]
MEKKKGLLMDDDCPSDEHEDVEILRAEEIREKDFLTEDRGPTFAELELRRERRDSTYKEYEQDDRFSYFGNYGRYNDSSRFDMGSLNNRAKTVQTSSPERPQPVVNRPQPQRPVQKVTVPQNTARPEAPKAAVPEQPKKSGCGCMVFVIIALFLFRIVFGLIIEENGIDEVKSFLTENEIISEIFGNDDESGIEEDIIVADSRAETLFKNLGKYLTAYDYAGVLSLTESYKHGDYSVVELAVTSNARLKGMSTEEYSREKCIEFMSEHFVDMNMDETEEFKDWSEVSMYLFSTDGDLADVYFNINAGEDSYWDNILVSVVYEGENAYLK